MPTTKKRINLSVDDQLYSELENLRKIKGAPSLSSIVIELAKSALELEEDLYFAKLAEERENEGTLTHSQVWKIKK